MATKNYTNTYSKFNKSKTGAIHGKVDKENLSQYLLKHQDAFHETTGFPTTVLQNYSAWENKKLKSDRFKTVKELNKWIKEKKTGPLSNYIKNLPTKEKVKAVNKIKK